MKSIIIDDEESARERLRRLLGVHAGISVIGEARDGLEAVRKIEELRPDLIYFPGH
jgi:YesN/AraC family two-component response regulator